MMPKRSLLRAWSAFLVGLLVLLLVLFRFSDNQSSLSPLEARLVGKWHDNQPEDARSFFPDRTYSTSNGQFVGTWRVTDGRLTVTYWQTFQLPIDYSIAAVVHSIKRTRKETVSLDFEFVNDSQQLNVNQPVSEHCPDGKWQWTRVPSM